MKKVYLDNAADTPVHKEVLEAMLPYFKENFGNPSSLHSFGEKPREALEKTRGQVAQLIGASPKEIIFTASGSEANNLAIKGLSQANLKKGNHIIISQIEHFSVLQTARSLGRGGFEITYLPVDKYGLVDPGALAEAITDQTILISVMHGNNEIGTIEPITELSQIAKKRGVTFHTDAIATAGTIPIDVDKLGVDSLALAANQFYGPLGAAALYVRKGQRIKPQIIGGIQEGGRRAGTENVAALVGMGKAAAIAKREMNQRNTHLTRLRDRLLKNLTDKIDESFITGHPTQRLPGHASVCIKFVEGESMLMFMDMEGRVAASSGSACTSRALKASHVLLAIGVSDEVAHGSLVFTLGEENTQEDVDRVLKILPPIVERLRKMSPLYTKYLKEKAGPPASA